MKFTAEQLKLNQSFVSEIESLNGDCVDYQAERYANLYKVHTEKYGTNVRFFSSPGRIEVIGNHTDHNNGKVVCASISVDNIGCVTPIEGKIIVASIGYPVVEVDLNDLLPNSDEHGKSEALVRGLAAYFVDNGYKIGGFAATTTSDVFNGAGVSSSASFELLVCEMLNVLYNDGKMDAVTKAKASQYAENVYFGKPCGLLDQCAISLGGVSYIDFESTINPVVESVQWKFDDINIVITNTGGDHADLTQQYADIRFEMEAVAEAMGAKTLRGVDEKAFYDAIPSLQSKVNGRAILRSIHFFEENKRVQKALAAVKSGDEQSFAAMINASGDSSWKLLQNCYPLGDTAQRIPFALSVGSRMSGVVATRVHGGGFAGTIIAYVKKSDTDAYVAAMREIFGQKSVFVIGVRNSGAREVIIK